MAKIGYPASSYRARFSKDYLKIEPIVLEYIEIIGRPDMVIRSDLEAYVMERIDPRWMNENRIPHCIADAMHLIGYDKRSNRGRCWDLIYDSVTGLPLVGWMIRVADVRRSPPQPWKKVSGCGDFFATVDEHPVRKRRRTGTKSVTPGVAPLTAFVSL